jgi:hypothetical protein
MKIKLWVMSSVSLAMATLTACSSVHKVGENEQKYKAQIA